METVEQLDPRIVAFLLQFLRLTVWLVLLSVIFLPLERLFAVHPKKIFRKHVLTDLVYYFLSSLLPASLLAVPLSAAAWLMHHFMPGWYLAGLAHMPLVVRLLLSLVVGEIGFYWGHRWTHEIPFLWRFHAVHHSATDMDFLVNTKAHPIDIVFVRLCGLVPLYILGLAAPVRGMAGTIPLLVVLLGTVWGFFIHSNVRWRFGPAEWVIATPAFHHWHHTNDHSDLYNKNFASMLPFLDRCFGTLYLPKNQHPQSYGIHEKLSPNLVGQIVDPFLIKRKSLSSAQIDPK